MNKLQCIMFLDTIIILLAMKVNIYYNSDLVIILSINCSHMKYSIQISQLYYIHVFKA